MKDDIKEPLINGGITICAFRYALHRHSYVTYEVAEYIWENWANPGLEKVRPIILRELQEYLKNMEDTAKDNISYDIDYSIWKGLYDKISMIH